MRIALLCGTVGGLAAFGAAAWPATEAMWRAPNAERFLLFDMPSLLLAAAAGAGLYLVGRAWPHREGEDLYCARCGHPWSPETRRLNSNCQECGAPWRWFGGRVRGRPTRRPWLITLGVLLVMLPLVAAVFRKTAAARLAASSPTWLLVRTVDLSPSYRTRVQWDELMTRPLPGTDRELLARAILEKRLRERSIPAHMASWIEGAGAGHTIPSTLTDRWFDEMFAVTMSAPRQGSVGEPVHVIARAQYLGGWLGLTDQAQVVVGGLNIDGEEGTRARYRWCMPASSYASDSVLVDEAIVPQREGVMTVRLRVYFFIGEPRGAVTLDADGAPDLGSVVYAKPVDLERTIETGPAPAPR